MADVLQLSTSADVSIITRIESLGFEVVQTLRANKVYRARRISDGLDCTVGRKPCTSTQERYPEIWQSWCTNRARFKKLILPRFHGLAEDFVIFDYLPGTIIPWTDNPLSAHYGGATVNPATAEDIVTLSQELDLIGVFSDFHWGNFVLQGDGRIGLIDWEHIAPCRRSSPRLAYLFCLMFKNLPWRKAMLEAATARRLVDYRRFREDLRYRATLFRRHFEDNPPMARQIDDLLQDVKSDYRYNAHWNGVDLQALLARSKYHVFEDLDQTKTLPSQIDCQGKFDCLAIERYDLAGKSLLDVGCNAGWFLKEYSNRGAAPVIGIDIEDEWCSLSRSLMKNIYRIDDIRIDKCAYYEFVHPGLDFIVATSVLHYFEDKARFFEHAHRLLRDGGVLIVEVPVTDDNSDLEVLDLKPRRYIPGRGYLERLAALHGFRLDFFGRSNLRERRVFHFQKT